MVNQSWRAGSAAVEPGSFIQTVSGRRIDPFDPKLEEIEITDIARALSNQCRFGGHCRVFYSVAQHASLTSDLIVERTGCPGDGLWALLHDAAEAYLVDLPHPLKHRSELGRLYRDAEERLQRVILERFQLPATPPSLLKEIDRALLATERCAFSAVVWHWPELDGFEPLEIEIRPWRPERAFRELLQRFERLELACRCDWSLRPARPDDRDFLFELNETTMREHVERVWGWSEAEQVRFFDNRFEPDGWQIIEADAQDIGVVIVEETDDAIYLAEIQILPQWQGRGIGSSIVRSMMRKTRTSGKPLTLRVLHVNARARALYERLGFRPYKEIETHTYLRWTSAGTEAQKRTSS